jgi:hypothetical protein
MAPHSRIAEAVGVLSVGILAVGGCTGDGGSSEPAAGPSSTMLSATSSSSASTSPPASTAASSPSEPTTTPSESEPTPPPRLVDYDPAQHVTGPQDAAELAGAPASFVAFIGDEAGFILSPGGCRSSAGIWVSRLRTDGFAIGEVADCIATGVVVIWARINGSWRQVLGTQDLWRCKDLNRYRIPAVIAGDECAGETSPEQYTRP